MIITCSPQGFTDINRPNQAINDLKKAGFENQVLDFSLAAPAAEMEKLGKGSYRSNEHTIAIDNPKRLAEKIDTFMNRSKALGISFPIAQAPYLELDTKHADLNELLTELAIESIKACKENECHFIVVEPLFAGINRKDIWKVNKEFYLKLAGYAKENNVKILLKNQCSFCEGHLVRGICTDELEAIFWVDRLNSESPDIFGFCVDVGALNLCAKNMYDYLTALGDRVEAVIFRECDGHSDASMLPFTCVNRGQSQTDYLNLIRGLRKIHFDGQLVLEMGDSASAFSPMLKPAFFNLAKQVADFIKWQIEMETGLDKYEARVLFGAGNMCRNYMKNYGNAYPPLYTCDNNSSLWGQTFEGLEIHNPEDLKKLPENVAIYICNIYYREIEAQLREMGINNPIEFFNDEYMPSFYLDRFDSVTGEKNRN